MKLKGVTASLERRADWLFSLSDAIFDRPETAFQEYFASELLRDALRREGFEVTEGLGGLPTAFCGRFGAGGPVIGILGEYDALPGMSQQSGVTYPEPVIPGAAGHGCGHNLLGVGSLAAVIAVKDYLEANRLPGTVIYYGCPGEEGGAGKGFLARAGVFDGVDCVLTWHPASLNTAPPRTSLANRQMLYQFRGISAHAAAHPERGRSALDALTLMNTGIQFLREHIPATAKIHYAVLDAGGTSPNVVQSSASAMYLIREASQEALEPLVQRVSNVARGAALMTETEVTVTFVKSCANLIPNRVLSGLLCRNLAQMPLPEYTAEELALAKTMKETIPTVSPLFSMAKGLGGAYARFAQEHVDEPIHNILIPELPIPMVPSTSTDVGDVSWLAPTAEVQICTACSNTSGHTWQRTAQGKSAPAHKGLLQAGRVLAGAAIDLLTDPDLVAQARREWQHQLRGRTYTPMPPEAAPAIPGKGNGER